MIPITSNAFKLDKQINYNPLKKHVISGIISEYDIASAHPSALYFIKGKTLYDELMSMPKETRNIRIGNMIKSDKELNGKIAKLILDWTNLFIKANSIKASQFLESTKDSIMIYNKVPKFLEFEKGVVKFRNKEGEFSSYHRIGNKYTILFDQNMNGKRIRIKGISDEYVQSSSFVKKNLFKVLSAIELSVTKGKIYSIKNLQNERRNLIKSKEGKTEEELSIFRKLIHKNQYEYLLQVSDSKIDIIHSDVLIEDEDYILNTHSNYSEFILPLIKCVL